MAKKKNNVSVQQSLSPEKYIQTKARNLPVVECLIGENWQEVGFTTIVVARRHTNGNYTLGIYLTDIFCLGVKDSIYQFNLSEEEYKEYKEQLSEPGNMLPISYNEVHNLIWGSVAYAEEFGIEPCKEFGLTQYLLEEDSDDIPLIEYEFGKNGKPFLIVSSTLEGSRYLPLLEKSTGGDFGYFVATDDSFVDDDDQQTEDHDWPTVEYNYTHPEYPQELHLIHQELMLLYDRKHNAFLDKKEIDDLLSLPRETLIKDLVQIVRFEIGQVNIKIEADALDYDNKYTLMHSLLLLAGLEAEESLDTVLEVMRQNVAFIDIMFMETDFMLFSHTLYHVGRNKLQEIKNFLMEPGLETDFRAYCFSLARGIIEVHPERRDEIITWWRDLLNWFIEQDNNANVIDAELLSLMMDDLVEIKAAELLPEIKQLFDMDRVEPCFAGYYMEVKEDIESEELPEADFKVMDIYEWYAELKNEISS